MILFFWQAINCNTVCEFWVSYQSCSFEWRALFSATNPPSIWRNDKLFFVLFLFSFLFFFPYLLTCFTSYLRSFIFHLNKDRYRIDANLRRRRIIVATRSQKQKGKKTMQQCILRALQKLRRDAYIRRSFAILSGPTQIFLGRMRKIKADFTLFKLFPPSLNHTSPQSSLRIPPTVLRIPLYTYIYIYIVSSTLIEIYSNLHRQAPEITPR